MLEVLEACPPNFVKHICFQDKKASFEKHTLGIWGHLSRISSNHTDSRQEGELTNVRFLKVSKIN